VLLFSESQIQTCNGSIESQLEAGLACRSLGL